MSNNNAGYCHFPWHPGKMTLKQIKEKKCGAKHCVWFQENRSAMFERQRNKAKPKSGVITLKEIEQVLVNKPVNRTSSQVLSRGEHYEPNITIARYHSDNPLPTNPFTGKKKDDLTGRKFGRFTVVGFLFKPRNDSPSKWLVRCCCGKHEVRTTKAIKNPKNMGLNDKGDCCRYCEHIETMKIKEFKKNYGIYDDNSNSNAG